MPFFGTRNMVQVLTNRNTPAAESIGPDVLQDIPALCGAAACRVNVREVAGSAPPANAYRVTVKVGGAP
jgi:hypothetical protein